MKKFNVYYSFVKDGKEYGIKFPKYLLIGAEGYHQAVRLAADRLRAKYQEFKILKAEPSEGFYI